jgi:hypothetical protein
MTDANRSWQSVSVSASGQYQTAVISGGPKYRSSAYMNDPTLIKRIDLLESNISRLDGILAGLTNQQ